MLYVLNQTKNISKRLSTNVSWGTVPGGKNVESLFRRMALKCRIVRVNGVQVTAAELEKGL